MRLATSVFVVSTLALGIGCGGGDEEKKRVDPATLGQAGTAGNTSTGGTTGGGGKSSKAGAGGTAQGGAGGGSAGGSAGGAGGESGGGGGASGGSSAGKGGTSAGGTGGTSAGGSGGTSAGGSGGTSAGGSGGSAPFMGPDGNGTVAAVEDIAFLPGNPFSETATVKAAASDPSKPPSAMWTGSGKFLLAGLDVGERVWFTVQPTKQGTGFWTTLSNQTVPADGVMDLVVPVVKSLTLEAAVGGALDANVGYVVMVIRAPDGALVTNAQVKPAGAGKVFYDVGNNFSSSATGTGAKGLAIVGNLPAGAATSFMVTGTITTAEGPANIELTEIVPVEVKAVTYDAVTLAP